MLPIILAITLSADAGAPRVLVEETVVLAKRDVKAWALPKGNAHVSVSGVKNADKGFSLVVEAGDRMEVSGLAKGRKNGAIKAFSQDVAVSAEPFTLAIANTENLMERVSVHVRVTTDAP